MRVISYCDYNDSNLTTQINTAKDLNISNIFIRKVNDINVVDFSDDLIKEINGELRSSKLSIYAIDPLIKQYGLHNLSESEEAFNNYERAIIIATKLRVSNVVIRLPKIFDILNEFEDVKLQLDRIVDLAKKARVSLLINHEDENLNVLVYILKKYRKKDLSLIFNPITIVLNKESPVVGYRILKDYFDVIVTGDLDKKDNPELLGYGRVNIIDLFKRMNRDQYKGYFMLDERFSKFVVKNKEKKVSFFKKLFNSKSSIDNYLKGYSYRIFPNEEPRDVSILDIYLNQINVLKIAFKL